MKYSENDTIEVLARTLYGEARGEYTHIEGGLASLISVGNVVINRLKAQSWFGKTIVEVCHKPFQFSCWNEADPNRKLLMQETISDPIMNICRQVAEGVTYDEWPDLTQGSDHYHAVYLPAIPDWAKGQSPKLRLARHFFYKLGK